MFWRGDARPEVSRWGTGEQVGALDWPRNGSLLRGTVHVLPRTNVKWLHVDSWCQVPPVAAATGRRDQEKEEDGDQQQQHEHEQPLEWVKNCLGLWMPLEQNGLLLHKVEEEEKGRLQ